MELKISEDERINGILITGNFTTDRDKAVAYSGCYDSVQNRMRAEELRQQGYQTIEDTQGGKALNQALPFEATLDAAILGKIISKDDYDRYWSEASNRFSTSQEGDITTRVVGALEDRDFRAVELPNFLADKAITSINGIPREELAAIYQTSPEEAFNRICEAEQSRTLQHGRESQSTGLADAPKQQAEMNKAAEREARIQAFRECREEYRQRQERDREAGREQDQGRGLRR